MRSTRLVAESLRIVPVPHAGPQPPSRPATLEELRRAWCAAWQPARADATAPPFLRAGQVDPWRRILAALAGWHGALLAEPPGTGKTWIALATAVHQSEAPVVIGPAVLRDQWERTSARVGVAIGYHSMERLSRGVLPPGDRALVIVDEAHRLRHLDTRRTRTLAPWLAGRDVLMLTGTPIVNRLADMIGLLRLMVADDALALDGIPSLEQLTESPAPVPSLRRLVIRSPVPGRVVPVETRTWSADRAEARRAERIGRIVDGLVLGRTPATRRLVASVLLDAGASSDAAWLAALRRYRALLLQAREAGAISRSALRRFAGAALEQTVLWPLLGETADPESPPLDDLAPVEAALAMSAGDEALWSRVAALVADARPTICFCRHLATAITLARHLGHGTAWITGTASGIGPHRVPRSRVLAAFGPARDAWRLFRTIPTVLVTTEVTAEGLDLHGASRVIHVDLPWHPARQEQRTGRVARLGQRAASIEEIVRGPAPAIERRLRLAHHLRRKHGLVEEWLHGLSRRDRPCRAPGAATWCALAADLPAEGIALVHLTTSTREGTCPLILRDGRWELLSGFPAAPDAVVPVDTSRLRRIERSARRATWRALQAVRVPHRPDRRLVARLLAEARRLRSERQPRALDQVDRLLALAAAPMPLGMEWRLAALADGGATLASSGPMPPPSRIQGAAVSWVVLLHSLPRPAPLR